MIILYVLLGIIYMLIGSEIGAIAVLSYLAEDEDRILDVVRDLSKENAPGIDRVAAILGVGVALAIIVPFWPVYLVYLIIP